MTDRPRPLAVCLASLTAGSFAVAALDVTLAVMRGGEATSLGSYLEALFAAVALYGVAAVIAGASVGLVANGVVDTIPAPLDRLRRWRRSLEEGEHDRGWAAGVMATAAAAGVLATLVFVFLLLFALEMANKRNAALSTALVTVFALPLAALAWFPLYRAMRGAARLLPRPRALWALGGMAAVGLVGAGGALFSVDWRVINFGPFFAALALTVGSGLHALWWYAGRGDRLRQRASPKLRAALAIAAALTLVAASLATWTRFGDDVRATSIIAEETSGARPLLLLARRLTDRDGDGFSARFGGGDCDDRDAHVHPGATDVPGDGIDQDCSGADAPIRAATPVKPPTPPTGSERKIKFDGNLLVITIDTLRADRLDAKHMPRLDAFARHAVHFTHAYAQAPNTPRSFPSFLTGRFPSQVKWARETANFSPILDDNLTFFQALQKMQVRNLGVFSHFYLTPAMGITHGFDVWDNAGALTLHDSNTDVAAPRITPRVVARLDEMARTKQRFALWTHYFEPHSRYMTHPEFPIHATGVAGLEEKYDGEVAFVDRHLGLVFDALARNGLDKNTAVVIFSDHGEAFGEHRFGGEQMFFHGQTLYDELLRVPLVVRVPGVTEEGRKVDGKVMLVDVAPTVVDLMGGPPSSTFQGRSLAGALAGEPLAEAPVFAELLPAPSWNHSWRVLIEGQRKLLYKISENSLELYDLGSDPREQRNLASKEPAEVARLKQALLHYVEGARR